MDEVGWMFAASILDAKIVDHKRKDDGTSEVHEESGSVGSGDIAVDGKVLEEPLVGDDASLGEAVNSLADLDEYVAFVDEMMEVVRVIKDSEPFGP
jgi:hypothetical protein